MGDAELVEQTLEVIEDVASAPTVDLVSISLQLESMLENQNLQIQLSILLLALIAAFFVSYAIFRYLKWGADLEEMLVEQIETHWVVDAFTSSFGTFVVSFSLVFLVGYFAHLAINFIKGV